MVGRFGGRPVKVNGQPTAFLLRTDRTACNDTQRDLRGSFFSSELWTWNLRITPAPDEVADGLAAGGLRTVDAVKFSGEERWFFVASLTAFSEETWLLVDVSSF